MHLTVIAKEPRPGFVKTRLCPPCSPLDAADLAAAALGDTLDAVDRLLGEGASTVTRVLLFDGDATGWERPGWRVVGQRGAGLDERLAHAFDDLGPGVIAGMETPHAIGSLGAALSAVARGHDAIGLAVDGGYWSIGLGRVDGTEIRGVPMSTSHTGFAQLNRLHASGRSVRRLPFARDLDVFDDVVDAARRPATGAARLHSVACRVVADVSRRG